MIRNNNIFLKLCLFLMLIVGWGGSAWAALPESQNWESSTFTKLGDGNYKFYAPYYMSEPITVTTQGNLSVNYRYTGGAWAFPGVGFDLVDDNGVVTYSSYAAEAIGTNKNKTYTVDNVVPGNYSIRYLTSKYSTDGDFLGRTDPAGTITVSGTAATGFTPTITGWTHQGWHLVTSANPGLWDCLSFYNSHTPSAVNIHANNSAATTMTGGETVVVKFQKTSGSANLNIKGVELLDASNKIVAAVYSDVTISTTGEYTLNVPANGTYTVRTLVQTSTENNVNCAGTITYAAPEKWIVKINDGYKVVYNGHNYGNNEELAIDINTHDYRAITVNAPSTKAVWGPLVDYANKTITFEISDPVAPQAGRWYKVQVLPTSGNLGANMVNAFNSRIKAEGVKGNYIYVQNAEQPSNRSDYRAIHCFMGMPENEAVAYVYVNYFTNNNILLQHINGRYINQEGKQQTTVQSSSDVLLTRENSGDYAGSYYWNKLQPFSLNDADIAHYFGRSSNSTNNFHTYFTEVNPSAKFDMYRVVMQYEGTSMTTTSMAITYSGSENHGFNSVYHGGYFFFTKSASITPTDFNVPVEGETITINPSAKTITVTLPLPDIDHRTPWTVDKVNSTGNNVPPAITGFLQPDTENKGMKQNPNTGTYIQNVPVFEMTEYIKPGSSKRIWLPTCNTNGSNSSLWSYQRWYDYRTEGTVDPAIYNFPTQKPNGKLFGNGYVTGAIYGDFIGKEITVNLPVGTDSYELALDHSRFEDYKKSYNSNDNLLEPTISQRVIYHLIDANVMAQKLEDVPEGKWLEEYTIHFPSYKMGSKEARNGFDVIGLDQTFGNYWYYANATDKANNNPTQVSNKNDFSFNVTCTDPSVNVNSLGVGILEKNNNTMPTNLNLQLPSTFASQRFIMFNYPASRKFADKSQLVIEVSVHGKRVAKFTLIFDDGTEPLPILDVLGKDSNGMNKSSRSTSAMIKQFGQPIAKVSFDAPQIAFQFPTGMTTSQQSDNTYNWSSANNARYGLPVSNEYTDYSFFGGGGSGNNQYMAMGEYRLESGGNGTSGRAKIRPVEEYEVQLHDESNISTTGYKQYFAFADVSEMPGKIISLPFSTTLCSGQRIYMQGWVGSATSANDNGQQQSGIVLNVYGIKGGNRTLIYSYCPGIISSAIEKDGVIYRAVENDYSGYRQVCADNNDWSNQGFLIWNQVNCSFLVDGKVQYDSYLLEVDNNSYSSTGCDVVIDNFCVFANPPKGDVDFTTPLCSDKVRHAKIHTDFDMLLTLNNVEENDPNRKLTSSYCFLEASVFDCYSEGGLSISDLFVIDDKGNHNLKSGYDEGDEKVKSVINHAFRAALVGRRCTNAAKDSEGNHYEDHGFHSYDTICSTFSQIQPYAYNDSRNEVVYRETDEKGLRRIVFKEDVIRGEMSKVEDADGHYFYPHLRPSTTYYLVFAARPVTEEDINEVKVGTDVFGIHQSCSFFGKFTTKDPMHVILDKVDIESELPVQAVCHGETVEFTFEMPVIKENLGNPIFDEANCTSIEGLDGQEVPGKPGEHYKYEPLFVTESLIQNRIKNLPYDWWFGGRYIDAENSVDMSFGASHDEYMVATHPTIKYDQPHDIAHKKHGDPVKIEQAMEDFRFYYPDFGEGKTNEYGECSLTDTDWATVTVKDYNSDTGYGLLQSEINAIKDLVTRGILKLHRNTYKVPLTADNAVIEDGQKIIYFTLIPIQPSLHFYVDEQWIYCPDPRGVRVKITTNEPKMLDGFAGMEYPEDMENVPMRVGLTQIKEVPTSGTKTLRIPLRKLQKAIESEGHHLARVDDVKLYLVATDDPAFERVDAADPIEGEIEDIEFMAVGEVKSLRAVFAEEDNYMHITFNAPSDDSPWFREGYIYRLSFEYIEQKANNDPTISCSANIFFDMKVVPEYQKWTGEINSDWTNDQNWARADREELHADNDATGDVIAGSTDITVAANYPTNTANQTSRSFVPMYFTNVLIDDEASNLANLYVGLTPASRTAKTFLSGLESTATDRIIYDMEVALSDGTWHTEGNYECGLFGTYVAKGITFLPGAQLINAHYLDYKKAWVEYELSTDQWYTLASPLQNTFAGEWYSPTDGGKQLTPHFYDITYQQGQGSLGLNDRFRPAYYQRSWDSQGNNPVYLKEGGQQEAFIMADWSYVYNDVTKEYSDGGFSVKVDDSHMADSKKPSDGHVLVRMPKADTQYTYFDIGGDKGQKADDVLEVTAQRHRLWSDELSSAATFSQTIENTTDGNNFFLVGNPFMAEMDMDQFFAANPTLEKKYWIMTANGQSVSVRSETGWITTSDQITTLGKAATLQGFFVKGAEGTKSVAITFDAEMQAVEADPARPAPTRAAHEHASVIRLTAERDGKSSHAVIVLSPQARDGYVAEEDCEAFIDANLYDQPTVYTSANGMAQTINVRQSLQMVPVGMISADDSEATLRFDLSESSTSVLYLYDSELNSYTEVSDGSEVTMSGNCSGRYFISTSMSSLEQLTQPAGLRGVWTLSGTFCGYSIEKLTPGIYIVDGVKMLIR